MPRQKPYGFEPDQPAPPEEDQQPEVQEPEGGFNFTPDVGEGAPGIWQKYIQPSIDTLTTPLTHHFENTAERDALALEAKEQKEQWLNQRLNDLVPETQYTPGLGSAKAMTETFLNEMNRGLGREIDKNINPLNIATTAATMGESAGLGAAVRAGNEYLQGAPEAADAARRYWKMAGMANRAKRALSVPYVLEGGHKVLTGPDWTDRVFGAAEAGLGYYGMKSQLPRPTLNINETRTYRGGTPIYPEKPLELPPPGTQVPPSGGPEGPSGGGGFTEGEFKEGKQQAPKYESPRRDEPPSYFTTSGKHTPVFDNDVDRAMWMVSELRPSAKYNEYLEFLKRATGHPVDRVVGMSNTFGKYTKEILKTKGPGTHAIPAVYGSPEWNATRPAGAPPPTRESGMTGERVRDVYKMEPGEAVKQGLVTKDDATGLYNHVVEGAQFQASGIPGSRKTGQYYNSRGERVIQAQAPASKMIERSRILKGQIDEAYKAGDTNTAVEKSQELDEIQQMLGRTTMLKGQGRGEESSPGRPFRSDPYRRDLEMTTRPRGDILQADIDASASQKARAISLGIDPQAIANMNTEDLSIAIGNARASRSAIEPEEPQLQPAAATLGGPQQRPFKEPPVKAIKLPDGTWKLPDGRIFNPKVQAPEESSFMRVPGTTNPQTGLSNIAIGPQMTPAHLAPQLIKSMAVSLYSKNKPRVIAKELTQNWLDEHDEIGQTEPGKVVFGYSDKNPVTGAPAHTMTVRDAGRGMTPEQLYTYFTDLASSGKRNTKSARGGFGVAKAAPLGASDYVKVESIVDDPGGSGFKVMYKFEGTPDQLIDQLKGVPMNMEVLTNPDAYTGLSVKTYWSDNEYFTEAQRYFEQLMKFSHNLPSDIIKFEDYNSAPHTEANEWLRYNKPLQGWDLSHNVKTLTRKPAPATLQHTMNLPGADVNIHYDPVIGNSTSGLQLAYLNKGTVQEMARMGTKPGMEDLPEFVQVDIIPTVEEGQDHYPFTMNREQINDELKNKVTNWLWDNLGTDRSAERQAKLQQSYDGLQQIMQGYFNRPIVYYDQGGRFLPSEIDTIKNNSGFIKAIQVLDNILNHHMDVADKFGWTFKPSTKVKKFGLLIAHTDNNRGDKLYGVHIPNPNSGLNDSAILIALFQHIVTALTHSNPLDVLVTGVARTIGHELAHTQPSMLEDPHGPSFNNRNEKIIEEMGKAKHDWMLDLLEKELGDGHGNINPRLLELLPLYEAAGQRAESIADPLLGTGTLETGQTANTGGTTGGNQQNTANTQRTAGFKREAYELSRGLTASGDLSGTLRQPSYMIGTNEWWKAIGPSWHAAFNEGKFDEGMAAVENLPVVKDGIAHDNGLALTDLSANLSRREELLRSTWAEKIPFGIGAMVRGSNRAYTLMNNMVRASYLQKMYDNMLPGERSNPYYLRQACQFINDATGRGRYEIGISPHSPDAKGIEFMGGIIPGTKNLARGRIMFPESMQKRLGMSHRDMQLKIDFEKYAPFLNDIMFSGRMRAANWRMLNPGTWIALPPKIRQEYLNALLRKAAFWATAAGLFKLMGAKINTDPLSADFLKGQWGPLRVDPGAGTQQIIVLLARMMSGKFVSSLSGRETTLGQGFKGYTRGDVGQNYITSGLHPIIKFGYDLAFASQYRPFNVADRTMQLFLPMVAGDLAQVYASDPKHFWAIAPTVLGMGSQTYEKGGGISDLGKPVFTPAIGKMLGINPEKLDYQFQGGPLPIIGKYLSR